MNQPWMFVVFFAAVFSLFGLMQYRLLRLFRLWTARAFHETRRKAWVKTGTGVLIALNTLFVLQFPLRITSVYDAPIVQVFLVYPSGLFFATIVFSFLLVTAADLLRWTLRFGGFVVRKIQHNVSVVPGEEPLNEHRRRLLRLGGLSAAAAAGSFPAIASLVTARDYQINTMELAFRDFPRELAGLKIVQVSDIHSGIYMTEPNMKEIVDLVNSLQADVVVLTGDFVDSADSQIEPLSNALKGLKARLAVYGCLGNHDHFATASKVSAAVAERGIVMLNNAHETIMLENRPISVIGIDDAGRGRANFADLDAALDGVDPESFKVLLTHRPDTWDESRQRGIHLTLAGHTHGGQVGIRLGPVNLNPVHLVHKYAMGLYTQEEQQLYVNVGVGMVGVPIRMVRPEIAAITLKSV